MIIGETFNINGYKEENYDYLLKGKSKAARQQKRIAKKDRRQERKLQKQDTGKRKHLLRGNFGLFDKNRKKIVESAADPSGLPAEMNSDNVESSAGEKTTQTEPETPITSGESASSLEDQSGVEEFSYDEPAETKKTEAKVQDKKDKTEEAAFSALLGIAFMGITVLLLGVALYRTDKKSQQTLYPHKIS